MNSSEKSRLLLLADTAAPHTRRWANWFAKRGWEVHVISFNPIIDGDYKDVKFHFVWNPQSHKYMFHLRFLKSIVVMFRVWLKVKKIKPDIVHSHSLGAYSWSAMALNRRPLVVTPWGTDLLVDLDKSRINKLLAKISLIRADLVTTDAYHFIERLEQLGIHSEKIKVVFFGTDIETFQPRQFKDNENITVISTRTLNPVHSVGTLIEAIPNVTMKYPLIRFLIVGEGTEKQMLTERCLELGIGQCVEFVGGVKESEMASLLRSADLYVSTSPLDAGLAASTSEAMASGLPIIHPNTADNQFWSDNTSGRLFEVGNVHSLSSAIIELLECSYEWKEMGKRNRTRIVNDNNIDSILQNMNVGYHKLLEIKNK